MSRSYIVIPLARLGATPEITQWMGLYVEPSHLSGKDNNFREIAVSLGTSTKSVVGITQAQAWLDSFPVKPTRTTAVYTSTIHQVLERSEGLSLALALSPYLLENGIAKVTGNHHNLVPLGCIEQQNDGACIIKPTVFDTIQTQSIIDRCQHPDWKNVHFTIILAKTGLDDQTQQLLTENIPPNLKIIQADSVPEALRALCHNPKSKIAKQLDRYLSGKTTPQLWQKALCQVVIGLVALTAPTTVQGDVTPKIPQQLVTQHPVPQKNL